MNNLTISKPKDISKFVEDLKENIANFINEDNFDYERIFDPYVIEENKNNILKVQVYTELFYEIISDYLKEYIKAYDNPTTQQTSIFLDVLLDIKEVIENHNYEVDMDPDFTDSYSFDIYFNERPLVNRINELIDNIKNRHN